MTRGYTRREAVRMIVAGFFQQVFDRITIESVRDALGEAIGRRVSDIKELAGAVTRWKCSPTLLRFVGLIGHRRRVCGFRPAACESWSPGASMSGGDRPSSLKLGLPLLVWGCCCCLAARGWQIGHTCNELISFQLRRRPRFPIPANCWSRSASGWSC